ncbi:hypothetical protein PspLS_08743 [Pyricularia sp. CBS 133598]|nr:hypothetical protein PspLS_08743 [Pyricularia sp. CBS 133598]
MLLTTALLALSGLASAASLQRVNNFGNNPANVKMFIYVPDRVATNPAIVVAVHHCQGTANSFYGSTPYARLADQKGFIVIYPESPYQGTCFDVSSRKTLTHDGGGDSNSIANMVKYAITQYRADAKKVHLVGASSGAMMANVMAATYPELFQTVIAHSGVPAGCFMSASGQVNGWNSSCANGQVRPSQAVWTKMAKDMYPGYNGARPRMMIMHGGTDTTLHWNNYEEALKQWRGVLGVADSPTRTLQNSPESGYTTTFYGGDGQLTAKVKGVWNPRYGHNIPIIGGDDMAFMGL